MHPGALIWAASETNARDLLDKQLISSGLYPFATSPYTLQLVSQLHSGNTEKAQLLMNIK